MDVTKPYEFIGFGAMDVTKTNEFIWFEGGAEQGGTAEHRGSGPLCGVVDVVLRDRFRSPAGRLFLDAHGKTDARKHKQRRMTQSTCDKNPGDAGRRGDHCQGRSFSAVEEHSTNAPSRGWRQRRDAAALSQMATGIAVTTRLSEKLLDMKGSPIEDSRQSWVNLTCDRLGLLRRADRTSSRAGPV